MNRRDMKAILDTYHQASLLDCVSLLLCFLIEDFLGRFVDCTSSRSYRGSCKVSHLGWGLVTCRPLQSSSNAPL